MRYWSTVDPHLYEDVFKQGGEKVMCWEGIVNGETSFIQWFEVELLASARTDTWPSCITSGTSCLKSSTEEPLVQQEGAPCHCSNQALTFFHDKFENCAMSGGVKFSGKPIIQTRSYSFISSGVISTLWCLRKNLIHWISRKLLWGNFL